MKKLLYLIAGARPNFMKIAPLIRELEAHPHQFEYRLVHTGQHYDREMSAIFFQELGIPQPDYFLNCGGGSHAEQTAKIMIEFERVCSNIMPDCVVVVGDVNSTMACAIVAKKFGVRVAHIEAGLRSGDMAMPEEINRIITDSVSDWFFCTESDAVSNLLKEGKSNSAVYEVGNIMIDNLYFQNEKLASIDKSLFQSEGIKKSFKNYGVVTLHRPSNVDQPQVFISILKALKDVSEHLPLIFPMHPRTREKMENLSFDIGAGIVTTAPMSYMEFLNLWKDARLILTDSGGLQEESTALGVTCLTLRNNTERPVTCTEGTNKLVGTDPELIVGEAIRSLAELKSPKVLPALWDGRSSERIVYQLSQLF